VCGGMNTLQACIMSAMGGKRTSAKRLEYIDPQALARASQMDASGLA
jgi:hypothetical protein